MYNGGFFVYRPDFLMKLSNNHMLVLETKGKMTEKDKAKREALALWIDAVNSDGSYGIWHSDMSFKEMDVDELIDKYASIKTES